MAHRNPPDSGTASLVESYPLPPGRTTLDAIAAIPEEQVWLASRKSPQTRRAYRRDVDHFMRTVGIRSVDELRTMDHRAVLAWETYMREVELAEASTIRRRLAALSSLFKHLIKRGVADRNPVRDIERPPINRREGSTLAFSKAQARRLLDAPSPDSIAGLRDRAILSVGLQAGLRRAEIAGLTVGDLNVNRGFDSLRVVRKGAKKDAMAIKPQTAQRIRAYLDAAGHAEDFDGPLFRPLRHNGKQRAPRRHLGPGIGRSVRPWRTRYNRSARGVYATPVRLGKRRLGFARSSGAQSRW